MCNVLRPSLVQEKLEATTANCCFKYKADVPALPETRSQQQCNACNAWASCKAALVKPTCSLGDGLVVGGKTGTAGSLPAISLTWVCRQAPSEPLVITPSGNDVDYSTKDPRHGITKSTFKSLSLKSAGRYNGRLCGAF